MEHPTRAVVLAAGVGSRLRPITATRPKPCVTVGPRSILAHQLHAYADAGVTDVTIVAGYRAEAIRECCERVARERPALELSVIENERYEETNNMYSLWLAREAVAGERFVLSNGDVVFEPGVARRLAAGTDSAIACDRSTYDPESMKITLDGTGRVEHISKEVGENEADATSIDCYRFSAAFSGALFEEIDRRLAAETGDWTEVAIDSLLHGGDHDVGALDIAGARWVEIDDHEDLREADRLFSTLPALSELGAVFFDLDGTVYLDDDLLAGGADLIAALRERGVSVYFLSNNSSGWKDDYVQKLDALGIPASLEDVLLSTDGVISYLQETEQTAYVVGTEAMRRAMVDHGVETDVDDPDTVVVGFDTELTYEKARRATLAIREGAEFVLAHPDVVCPTTEGLVPDCGSIGALVEAATDRTPAHTFGKPNPAMIAPVLEDRGLDPTDVAVVGDRLETEIEMADRLGCVSVCVLSGEATRESIENSPHSPAFVAGTVGDLNAFV